MAEWNRRGVPRTRLLGPAFERASVGSYRRAGAPATTAQRIVDVVAGLPEGAAIAGWAAAYVHGVDLLDGLDDVTLHPLAVPVLLAPGRRRRTTEAIQYRQSSRRFRTQRIHGVPVTTLMRTALDLALHAPDVTEAVVGLDAVLAIRRVTVEQLQRVASTLAGRRGAAQATQAIDLARVGVRSTWESRLRMFAVRQLGWTGLQPNPAVFDLSGGLLSLLGVPDLLDVEAGLALEYDGATWRDSDSGHRDRAQHRADNEREERLERAGLIVVRVEKADLMTEPRRLAARLLAARADGLARDRSRDRWTLQEPEHWVGLPA